MNKSNIISEQKQFGDEEQKSLRPQKFKEFIGQDGLLANLKIFIDSAKLRNSHLDHVLLYGSPGLGKTTIAQLIAKELGVNFKSTSGPIITKAGDLAAILSTLQKGDVLFIDEIHRLNITIEEVLYPAMEDYALDVMIGEGVGAKTVRIQLPEFTLVGATTRLGLISNPLRDRFGIPLRLEFYQTKDLCMILERAAKILQFEISDDGSLEIAKRSRGTPRIALRLLKRVIDFAYMESKKIVDSQIADTALTRLEVDKLGLDSSDRKYLYFIADNYSGGPVGIETIAAGLAEQKDTIEDAVEPYLLQQGFILRTPRGRMLSDKAFEHLGLPILKKLDRDLFSIAANDEQ